MQQVTFTEDAKTYSQEIKKTQESMASSSLTELRCLMHPPGGVFEIVGLIYRVHHGQAPKDWNQAKTILQKDAFINCCSKMIGFQNISKETIQAVKQGIAPWSQEQMMMKSKAVAMIRYILEQLVYLGEEVHGAN